jgi:hypothetical protein
MSFIVMTIRCEGATALSDTILFRGNAVGIVVGGGGGKLISNVVNEAMV